MDNSYQHSTIAQILENILEEFVFEGESRSDIADILLSILNKTEYNKETDSVIADLLVRLKAKIEGSSFDPYDGDSTSRIADIIISILEETEYNEAPQSRIAELLLELKEELESITEVTVSGSVVSFVTNMVAALVSCQSLITGTQSGSGTPSPSNPRPLNSFSSGTLTANGNTYTFTFGQSIYKGSIDWLRGVIVGEKKAIKFSDINWNYNPSYHVFYFYPSDRKVIGDKFANNYMLEQYNIVETEYYNLNNFESVGYKGTKSINIRDNRYSSIADFVANEGNQIVVYELETPIEIPLEGIEIITVEGQNNIFCDTGDSEITYLYRGTPPQNALLMSKSPLIENIIQEKDLEDLKEIDELQELDILEKEGL